MQQDEPSFAEMAVALALAHSKLGLDLEKTKMIARRISLSHMGLEVTLSSLQRDINLVASALQLLKDMTDVESEVREIIARKVCARPPAPANDDVEKVMVLAE